MPDGISKSEFQSWLDNTAVIDCSSVDEIVHTDLNDNDTTYTDACDCLNNVDIDANDTKKVIYIGAGWECIDELNTGGNIERMENNGTPPVKIKRPLGA